MQQQRKISMVMSLSASDTLANFTRMKINYLSANRFSERGFAQIKHILSEVLTLIATPINAVFRL